LFCAARSRPAADGAPELALFCTDLHHRLRTRRWANWLCLVRRVLVLRLAEPRNWLCFARTFTTETQRAPRSGKGGTWEGKNVRKPESLLSGELALFCTIDPHWVTSEPIPHHRGPGPADRPTEDNKSADFADLRRFDVLESVKSVPSVDDLRDL